jgi:oligopeptidase B
MTTPRTIYDYNLRTGERVVKKMQPVLGDFRSDNYTTKRLWATAGDGVKVSMTSRLYYPRCTAPMV